MIGTAMKADIRRNSGARTGDKLILTKALGVGIYSAAFKKSALSREAYDEFIATTTLLNRVGAKLAKDVAVHAMTDVTGFGLLGHTLEMARGSRKTITIQARNLPFLNEATALAQKGFVTRASERNWKSYDTSVTLPHGIAEWQRQLYCDPQTSGGLLIACAPERADLLVGMIVASGYPAARIIGDVNAGEPGVVIEL